MLKIFSSKKFVSFFVLFVLIFNFSNFVFAQSNTDFSVSLLATPDSIEVTPDQATVYVDEIFQYTAIAKFDDGDPDIDITNDPLVSWDVLDLPVASVDSSGLLMGLSVGATSVTATYGGIIGSATLNVGTPPNIPAPPQQVGGGGSGGTSVSPPDSIPPGSSDPENPPMPSTPPEENNPPDSTPPGSSDPENPPIVFPASPPPEGSEGLPPPVPSSGSGTTSGSASNSGSGSVESGGSAGAQTTTPEINPVPNIAGILSEDFIVPENSVTRVKILEAILDRFGVIEIKKSLLESCYKNLKDCLSIFASYSTYKGLSFDKKTLVEDISIFFKKVRVSSHYNFPFEDLQLYPDVDSAAEGYEVVNITTMLGIVNGYYTEAGSPFKPGSIITRIQAVKVVLGTSDILKWFHYSELEAVLGGAEEVKKQRTAFKDIDAEKSYMWWYPRYLNKSCEIKMITCKGDFRPDEFITIEELNEMLNKLEKYLNENNIKNTLSADSDKDGLKTYLEQTVYLTNPNDNDTDDDSLLDGEEVNLYKTSPFLKDSDFDNLSDYDEVFLHKTNPLLLDSDNDGYSDFVEVKSGGDPLDEAVSPLDADENGVDDVWQNTYSIVIEDGIQDSDHDGLSDKLEYQYRTSPVNVDTDNDGFSDAQEILDLHTNANDPKDPGENINVRITSFIEDQLIADPQPNIMGTAPADSVVQIVLRNDFGHEKVLGQVLVDENNLFIFQVLEPLRDARYLLLARVLQPEKKQVIESNPVHIKIDTTLNVPAPRPKKLADQQITDEVILKNLRIEVKERIPTLYGTTEFGSQVIATWRSIVTTSALIADSASGDFAITSPNPLEFGNHEVYVHAIKSQNKALSKKIKISFRLTPSFEIVEVLKVPAERSVGTNILFGQYGSLNQFIEDQQGFWWIILGVGVLLVGSGTVYFWKRKKKR